MTDIWACARCHSINRQRSATCYKCGAPRETAEAGFEHFRQEQGIVARSVTPFRSSLPLAILAILLIVAFVGTTFVSASLDLELGRWASDQLDAVANGGLLDEAEYARRLAPARPFELAQLAIGAAALLAVGTWLARVVANVPALGGGVMGTTPYRAFITTLIPIVNLWKVPGLIQDVLYRLDPRAGGLFMVLLAWFGLFGGWALGYAARWYIDLRADAAIFNATAIEPLIEEFRTLFTIAFIVELVTAAMTAVGAGVLVLVMLRIERRALARDREVRAVAGV